MKLSNLAFHEQDFYQNETSLLYLFVQVWYTLLSPLNGPVLFPYVITEHLSLFEINSRLFLSRRTDGFFSIRVFFKLSDKNSACLLALSKIFLSFSDSCVLGTVSTRSRVSFVGEFFSSEFFCLVLFYSFYLEVEANRLFTYLRFFHLWNIWTFVIFIFFFVTTSYGFEFASGRSFSEVSKDHVKKWDKNPPYFTWFGEI